MEDVREELKQTLSTLGPRGRGKPYPKGLLEKLLSYTVARRRQGATLVEIGTEIGISWKTLGRWLSGRKGKPRFQEVAVVAAPAVARSIIVHGPRGLRIEGLDLNGVAELVRRLGE
jgi:transposase